MSSRRAILPTSLRALRCARSLLHIQAFGCSGAGIKNVLFFKEL